MDDSRCLRFFLEPTDTLHRRYEALRASFVVRRPLKEITQRSGYSYHTLRDVITSSDGCHIVGEFRSAKIGDQCNAQ